MAISITVFPFFFKDLMLGSICVNGLYLSSIKDGTYDKILATKDEKNNSGK